MDAISISTRREYDYVKERGYEPLIDRRFDIEIHLRVSIQQELFGKGHTPAENEKFYRWCWEHKPHYCEECMKPLAQYSATYVSHILTRAAHPEAAHDCRNVNILCFSHHSLKMPLTLCSLRCPELLCLSDCGNNGTHKILCS